MDMKFILAFLITFSSTLLLAQQKLPMSLAKEKDGQFFIFRAKVLPGVNYLCELPKGSFFTTMVVKPQENDCESFGNSYVIFDADTFRLKHNPKTAMKKSELSSQFVVSEKTRESFIFFSDQLDGKILFYFLNNQSSNEN